MQKLQSLIATVVLVMLLGAAFTRARHQAGESSRAKRRLLLLSGLAAAAGVVMIFWLPHGVPETPGSPGTLVVIALLWVFGGVFCVFSVPTFLGAFFARPRGEEAPDSAPLTGP